MAAAMACSRFSLSTSACTARTCCRRLRPFLRAPAHIYWEKDNFQWFNCSGLTEISVVIHTRLNVRAFDTIKAQLSSRRTTRTAR